MPDLEAILERNRAWAESTARGDPSYFRNLAREQHPSLLWIGCSDSRVPVSVIAGLDPGEVFEHRNIANVVPNADVNALSVIEYAVDALGVDNVVVCGHYGCGGVAAALAGEPLGLIDAWLLHIQDVARAHGDELADLPDEAARHRRLCELNAIAQARNVARTPILARAWTRGQQLSVHAWIYDLADGRIRDLGFVADGSEALRDDANRTNHGSNHGDTDGTPGGSTPSA